jgi:hypothetical protein
MNYLNLVNAVLKRLREDEVTSVTDNNYAKLIGSYVNDSKQEVENAYSWNALTSTIVATTVPNVINYTLVGSGHRFEVIDVWNNSDKVFLENTPSSLMTQWLLTTSPQKGSPGYYAFNGQSSTGNVQVDLYPIPDAAYNIYFNVVTPQAEADWNIAMLSWVFASLSACVAVWREAATDLQFESCTGFASPFLLERYCF